VFHKKEPLYFRYNSSILWAIFIISVPLETGKNTLPCRRKQCHLNFTVSPLYLDKLKIAQKTTDPLLQCVLSNRLFQTFPENRSIFISFPVCLKTLLLTQNILHSRGFYKVGERGVLLENQPDLENKKWAVVEISILMDYIFWAFVIVGVVELLINDDRPMIDVGSNVYYG